MPKSVEVASASSPANVSKTARTEEATKRVTTPAARRGKEPTNVSNDPYLNHPHARFYQDLVKVIVEVSPGKYMATSKKPVIEE